jgi:hypothetical protein
MAMETMRYRYHMALFNYNCEKLISLTPSPEHINDGSMPVIGTISGRAIVHGMRVKDLAEQLGRVLDKNFDSALTSAQGMYMQYLRYHDALKKKR